MQLLRYVDDDEPDLTLLAFEIKEFSDNIRLIWRNGGILQVEGYTKRALQALKEPTCHQINGNLVKRGGVDYTAANHPTVQGCLKRMRCWEHLAGVTLQAEYPAYELCQAFVVFALGEQRKESWIRGDSFDTCMRRVALAANTNVTNMQREINMFKPGALAAYTSGMSTFASWKHSIFTGRQKWEASSIVPALCKAFGCGISTHRSESGFSIVRQKTRPQSFGKLSLELEQDLVTILFDCQNGVSDALLEAAQLIWLEWLGPARKSPLVPRRDKGTKRCSHVTKIMCTDM